MKRRVLVVLAADAVEQPNWLLVPKSTDVVELVAVLMKPELRGEAGPAVGEAREYALFDWSGRPLPPDVHVGEVPRPGIVVAMHRDRPTLGSDHTAVWLVRHLLMRSEHSRDILFRFLASPDAAVEPDNIKNIDVFVSYSFEDGTLASGVVGELKSRRMETFLAESSLSTSRPWRDQLRDAVRSARAAVLLITPNSIDSSWVLAEAGAFASLATPTYVLYDGVAGAAIPKPLLHAEAIEPTIEPERWLDLVARHAQAQAAAGQG
jgi:hypothetical protein